MAAGALAFLLGGTPAMSVRARGGADAAEHARPGVRSGRGARRSALRRPQRLHRDARPGGRPDGARRRGERDPDGRGRRGDGQDRRGHAAVPQGDRRRRARDDADRLPHPERALLRSGERGAPPASWRAAARRGVRARLRQRPDGRVRLRRQGHRSRQLPHPLARSASTRSSRTQYFGGPARHRDRLPAAAAAVLRRRSGGSTAPNRVPFHAVNVLLHAAATLLLARLFLRLGIAAAGRRRGGAALRRAPDSRRGGRRASSGGARRRRRRCVLGSSCSRSALVDGRGGARWTLALALLVLSSRPT